MKLRTRTGIALLALLALGTAGCIIFSGQFVVTYSFREHGYDPLAINSASSVAGVAVDLNGIKAYSDHKSELKDVVDLAFVGDVTNLDSGQPTTVEVWVVTHPTGTLLTTDAAIRAAGQRVWGPMTVGRADTRHITWNESAKLFVGRKILVDAIKNGGTFDLYALGSNGYHFQVTRGALIAVIAAGK